MPRAAALGLVANLGTLRGGRLPLGTMLAIRRIVPLEDALVARRSHAVGRASDLHNGTLAALLGERELGGWSLSPGTVDFLEQAILEHRPELILEFGSGVSTACLAYFQRRLAGDDDRPVVVSVEENDERAGTTTVLLERLGLAGAAAVVAAPLADHVVEGTLERCYDLPIGELHRLFGGRRAGLVLVDGPSLPSGGSRFATLPLARDLIASGAVVFLDDARRDAELAVARSWKRLPWLEVREIHLVGKGVLEARVTGRTPADGGFRVGGRSRDPARASVERDRL